MSEAKSDPRQDPVLRRFRDAVAALYGPRLERMVLFGSRARGDAREDSDYDVAVFLRDLGKRWDESRKLADITTDILDATGAMINPLALPAGTYRKRTALMHELRSDGRDLLASAAGHAHRRPSRPARRSRRMSPEAAHYLRGAHALLSGAERVLERAGIAPIAAREAYLAALGAARAIIWERTGKVAKSHSGTHSEIARLAHMDKRIDAGFARFLAQGLRLKLAADYDVGERDDITAETAARCIADARRLIADAESLLAQPPEPPQAA